MELTVIDQPRNAENLIGARRMLRNAWRHLRTVRPDTTAGVDHAMLVILEHAHEVHEELRARFPHEFRLNG